jgi:hypothetical protein
MPLHVYIGNNHQGQQEKFAYFHERSALLQIAQSLWQEYSRTDKVCALLVNLQNPQADLIILTQEGLGVVEMKDCRASIMGGVSSEWFYLDENGEPTQAVKSGKQKNPLVQVEKHKEIIQNKLIEFNEKEFSLPRWINKNKYFFIQSAVVFTNRKFSLEKLSLDQDKRLDSWFRLLWLEGVTPWVSLLKFGTGMLSTNDIKIIATRCLQANRFIEFEKGLSNQEPYGFIWPISEGKQYHIPLNRDTILIGRDPKHPIYFPKNLISRNHAKIVRRAESVFIVDLESKQGTWLNGTRLEKQQEHLLQPDDEIILGNPKRLEESVQLCFRLPEKLIPKTTGDIDSDEWHKR